MTEQIELRVAPEIACNQLRLQAEVSTRMKVDINRIRHTQIVRRSIDARQRRVMVNLLVKVWLDQAPADDELKVTCAAYHSVANSEKQAIVVGAGPAGLFAALTLISEGIRPIVIERGKSVEERAKDMAAISREQHVNPESNYCFGEGGAGAYSDGKLYTRSHKRGPVEDVLRTFVCHGADERILVDVHPHIGTDRLPGVIRNIRKTIIKYGGEVYFSTRADRLIIDHNTVKGVITSTGKAIDGPVILATGHSARDIYLMLHAAGIKLEPKGIAVGVRLEHPQELIDRIQYHNPSGRGKYLPPAEYSMLTRIDGRAVYSFCMCPGGVIIPAATADGELVVNGMSPASRGGKFANSGMVVEVLPEDVAGEHGEDALKMMRYQENIEKTFSIDAEGTQNAPAQRMVDFVKGLVSKTLPSTTYSPGIHAARIDKLLPPGIAHRLQKGFAEFGAKARGFLTNNATLIGAETRTSSPVRIPRDKDTLQHIELPGLYPCGEGAGYAGGIVSAAIDGIRCAKALAARISQTK